jgi:hypothetical protein
MPCLFLQSIYPLKNALDKIQFKTIIKHTQHVSAPRCQLQGFRGQNITTWKKVIYSSMVKSVLLYGAETCSLCDDNRRRINVTEMDALRRSARISKLDRKTIEHTWVISEVLHTLCFLFKNEFILQNTFTSLQCNLHCALSQWSNVWESLVFLSGRLRC